MEVANRIVAEILEGVKERIKPGIETRELDELAEELCRKHQVQPAFKGYRGYPGSLCVSVNEEVVHGIPGPRRLKAGDLVSLDFGVKYEGYYGDAAITVGVGDVGEKARALMRSHGAIPVRRHRRGQGRRAPVERLACGARRWWKAPGSGSSGSLSGTASAGRSTKTRRSPISVRRTGARPCRWA